MNSILESSVLGVPMLVFPLNKEWDQNGNAARVVFHGIGLMGDMKNNTQTQIKNQIEALLNDSKFKENALKMSAILKSKYDDDVFLETFLESEHFI
jgi:UDP:flavonoid glycosyltransferase YjiC (YdhE family)